MELTPRQTDRAAGVLLAQACGDALGVPYEFAGPVPTRPEMRGGGLGPYAPGEWSDDTQMALCIADATSRRGPLTDEADLDVVADGFLTWFATGASDVGTRTRQVLRNTARSTGPTRIAARMTSEAVALHTRTGRTAGNGALMRTGVVGISALGDRDLTASTARRVAELTHADPLAGDSCVIWAELVRRAVLTGELDPWGSLSLIPAQRREQWATWLREAVESPEPARHSPNGFTVTALQAALAAVTLAHREETGAARLPRGLVEAVRAGDDTDTVGAIAGALLGALHGASAVPHVWRRAVHGWPGLRARDLVRLAVETARGGAVDRRWPSVDHLPYDHQWDARRPLGVPHPFDEGVVLGTVADLDRLPELGVDAVVSLCRRGRLDAPAAGVRREDHLEVWLVDSDDPDDNGDLDAVLEDAAAAVEGLRREGRRVLLHCVAAQQRAPSVALRYAIRRGVAPERAARAVLASVPWARGRGLLWQAARAPGSTDRSTKGA